jgi:hypothetical protein
MRHFTIAAGLALATMFAITPAMAEMGGPKTNADGQCRLFNGNSNNLAYSYWGACPNAEPKKGATKTVHVAAKHKRS